MDTYCARHCISDCSRVAGVWRAKVRRPAEHNCPAQRASEGCAERALGPGAAPSETSVSASSWQKSKVSRRGRSAAMTATRATMGCATTTKKSTRTAAGFPATEDKGAKVKARVTGEAGGRELVPRGHRAKSGGLTMRGAEVFGVGPAALDRAGVPDPAPPQPPDLPPTPVPEPGIPPEPDLPPGTPPPKPIT
jgi:hypothetical protein